MNKSNRNRYKAKLCALCGMKIVQMTERHHSTFHGRGWFKELGPSEEPKEPWCSNWKLVANTDGAIEPEDILTKYQHGYKTKVARSCKALSKAGDSVVSESQIDQNEELKMEDIFDAPSPPKQYKSKDTAINGPKQASLLSLLKSPKQSASSDTKTTASDAMLNSLKRAPEWKKVENLLKGNNFQDLPE